MVRGHRVLASALAFGAVATIARAPLSPLGIGSGLLMGARIALSIGLGAALAFALPASAATGIAAALLVAGGATRALLRAPGLVRALRPRASRSSRAALRLLVVAAGVVALCAIDRVALATPVGATLASIALAGPLLLVGTRVLGEHRTGAELGHHDPTACLLRHPAFVPPSRLARGAHRVARPRSPGPDGSPPRETRADRASAVSHGKVVDMRS